MEDTTLAPASDGIKTILAGPVAVVSVERPTSAEAQALERDFGLTRADLDLATARATSAAVLRRAEYVILRAPVPVVVPRSETLLATPVSLVVGRDFLLLIHAGEARPLLRFLRQLETDEALRAEVEARGVDGLLCRCLDRLLDVADAAQGRVERQVTESEEALARGEEPTRQDFSRALRRRGEARLINRLVDPLAATVREAAGLGVGSAEWDQLIARTLRLVEASTDNGGEQDGLLLAYAVATNLQLARISRGLLAVAALALPVLAVAIVVSLVYGSPLAVAEVGPAVALAVVGLVFIGALYLLRRQRVL